MHAAALQSAAWRAQPTALSPAGPQRRRACTNWFASRPQSSGRRALSDSDAEGGGGGSSNSGGSPNEEVQELLRLRAQAARLNELFFAPAAPGVSDLEGKRGWTGAQACIFHASLLWSAPCLLG